MKRLSYLVAFLAAFKCLVAFSDETSGALEKLQGQWNIRCEADKITSDVRSIVPKWYVSLNHIEFVISHTYPENIPFLNMTLSRPAVGKTFGLSLPVFYTSSHQISTNTYFENTLTPNRVKNESHICHLEFDEFGKWGGVEPDIVSFFICSTQSWRNSSVTKELIWIDDHQAQLTVQTHYGNPIENNRISCSLTR